MRTILLLALMAVCCLSVLCLSRTVPAAEPEAPQQEDPVLAMVGDHPIRQSDLDRLIEQFKKAGEAAGEPVELPNKEDLIEELIRRQSIRGFILGSDIEVDDAAVEAKWATFQEQVIAGGRTVEAWLEDHCLTEEELRQILFVQVGLETLAESRVTDEELASLDEEVSASHILIMTEGGPRTALGGALSDEDAKAKILSIKKEIDNGRPFEECAKAYSFCPSKKRGGDLGFFPRYGGMVEPFAKVAYALNQGEVSEPVKTEFGYHLIMSTGRRKTSDRDKEMAKNRLLQAKLREIFQEVKETVKVERFYQEDTGETEEPPTDSAD